MTDSRPLFSVVIPTYNRARKIVRAVESVLAQSMLDYDIWVVDDGSSDDTEQVLSPYLNRIHYLPQENNGVAEARNRGMRESRGTYLALLDSDDWWYPQKLELIASAVRAHPEVGLFYSQLDVINEKGEKLWREKSRSISGSGYLPLLKGDFLAASSAVIKRESLDRVGSFDRAMEPCEDWDLWLRIARWYPIFLVPKVLVAFEYTSPDKLTSNTLTWLNAHDKVIEKAFAQDPSLSPALCRSVRANIAYIKGRVCLQSNSSMEALHWFIEAVAIHPLFLKAHLYKILLSRPAVRHIMPQVLRRRLRLPAE